MPSPSLRRLSLAPLLIGLLSACATRAATREPMPSPVPAPAAAMPPEEHDHSTHDMAAMHMGMDMPVTIPAGALYTEADVRFMQGMIAHHAQAIYMSHLAASHGASDRVLRFATKIDQSQVAEIRLMQGWLRANGQIAPDTSSWRHMTMPGMLTAQQLAGLEAARDSTFDRRFLTLMIQHHRGALSMVSDLFATPLAAQDVDISVFANDVETVQTAEIGIMYQLLDSLSSRQIPSPSSLPPELH